MFAASILKRHPMEIEKVIRILTVFLVVAAFAVNVATRLLFPEASHASDIPVAIVLLLCLGSIWRQTAKQSKPAKEENTNE